MQQTTYNNVRFEMITTVLMKGSILWDITPCSLLKVNQCFRGTCCLHFQGQRISQVKNQCEAVAREQLGLFFNPEYGGDMFLQNIS
jgi:hypothetical protein